MAGPPRANGASKASLTCVALHPTEASAGPTQRLFVVADRDLADFADRDVHAWGHEPHVHEDEHQFLYTLLGHSVVWAEGRAHHLTEEVGLWLPAGLLHSARFDEESLVIPLCFDRARYDLDARSALPTRVSIHQRRRILAFVRGAGENDEPGRDLFDLLQDGGRLLPLPSPQTTAPQAVAAGLRAVPHDTRTVAEWAEILYTSPSTLRRAFVAETGLTFSEWRTRARLNASAEFLAEGLMVSAVAARVGFTSTNGFIVAFRRHFGDTPKAFASSHLCV